MVGSIKALNRLNNSSVLLHDEVVSLRQDIKRGLEEVAEANRRLSPTYKDPAKEVGAWRRVEPYKESEWRPLVKDDVESALHNIKKLDII